MDNQTTIGKLFGEEGISFSVPTYQRAYSWKVGENNEIGQVDQFLTDIKEHDSGKNYYLGHFLFEKSGDSEYLIIDGQQRLTTTVIFMSCLVRELKRREIAYICLPNDDKYPPERIQQLYLKPQYSRQRFSTVKEDALFFNKLIMSCEDDVVSETNRKSETRIRKAAEYFSRKMLTAELHDLEIWFKVLHTAVITTFKLEGEDAKVTATQIFAFQNDRGKGLTTLEKLKAFFMHQVYRYDSINAKNNIEALEAKFATIYSQIENILTPEDTVLNYHCQAFTSGWDTAFDNIKNDLRKIDNPGKTKWITDFVSSLCRTYAFMREIENAKNSFNCLISDVCILDNASSMPLILKLCHYNAVGNDIKSPSQITNALAIMERILFKLHFKWADYRTNYLIHYAKEYQKDGYDLLINKLKNTEKKGFKDYWDFSGNCRRYFCDGHYHYNSSIRYIFYKYENYLRKMAKQPMLTPDECTNVFREKRIENTLDHITPQTPDFTEYSEDFKNNWLNDLGNLSLLTWGNNSSKKNHNPALEQYRSMYNSVFYSQKEIYETLCERGKWGEDEIKERKERITNFIISNWHL